MDNDLKINIDLMNHQAIQGWFINTPAPEKDTIDLYLDGVYQGFTHATVERADVKEIYGHLFCGFSFDLSRHTNFQVLELKSSDKVLVSIRNNNFNSKAVIHERYSQNRHSALTQLNIDLSLPIEGENWYGIESTGCWAGPDLESTLIIPALVAGTYQLTLKVGNHFCDLEKMRLTLNDQPITFLNTEFPATVTLQAEIIINEDHPNWILKFVFAKTGTADEDTAHNRPLALFLEMITFTAK
ncbi:MAG: hypothetical protein KAG06_02090 [Methylococcales bacterium]|nr:hypothetical protein [Methylococcales bacterium]